MYDEQGASLAALVAEGAAGVGDLPPGEAGRAALVDLAVGAARVEAWAVEVKARAAARLRAALLAEHSAASADAGLGARSARSGAAAERDARLADRHASTALSLGLGVSLRAADRLVALGDGLAEQEPMRVALSTGRVDERQATAILAGAQALAAPASRSRLVDSFVGDPADPAARPRLVRELRRDGLPVWRVPVHKLAPIIAREVAALDPAVLERAEERARSARGVAFFSGGGTGPATLELCGPEPVVAAMYDQLDASARAARRAGATDSLDGLRFDAAAAAVTAGGFGLPVLDRPARRPGPLVHVLVTQRTLSGQDDRPAAVRTPVGDVPVTARTARGLAADPDALWRTVVCDPATGVATDVSATYRPPAALAEFVRVRDGGMSRFPTSGARQLELDHVEPYDHGEPSAGGATTAANLAATGKRDHQAKTDGIVRVSGDAGGRLSYSAGTGHTYYSWPHQYFDPVPPDPASADGGPPLSGPALPDPAPPDPPPTGDPPG